MRCFSRAYGIWDMSCEEPIRILAVVSKIEGLELFAVDTRLLEQILSATLKGTYPE